MKLVSFGEKGQERAGILCEERILDINKANPAIPGDIVEILKKGHLNKVSALSVNSFEDSCYFDISTRLGPVFTCPSQLICLGLNYRCHTREANLEIPKTPLLFAKAVSTINGPYDDIVHPGFDKTEKMDYEVELAMIISQKASKVKAKDAEQYIAGYALFNDISARDIQFRDGQWFRGKSFDTFGPIGPYMVTPDEINNTANLRLTTKVNNQIRQQSNTSEMIFKIPEIVEFITSAITLSPGDIIATGTPAGVGFFLDPPTFLKPGDVVEIEIEGLGCQKNKIVNEG